MSLVQRRPHRDLFDYVPAQYQAAVRIGRYMYRNRKKIRSTWNSIRLMKGRGKRMASKYALYRRPRKKRTPASRARRGGVGERPGTSNAKRFESVNHDVAFKSTRTLYSHVLNDTPQGLALDERQRQIINLRGLKICMDVSNSNNRPTHFNWAIVSPKNQSDTNLTSRFFRGNGTTRSIDFGVNLQSAEFSCNPINADKYVVLTHQRHLLGVPKNSNQDFADTRQSYLRVDRYIKIGRQFRFAGNGDNYDKLLLVYWFDGMLNAGGQLAIPQAVQMSLNCVSYFRDTRN